MTAHHGLTRLSRSASIAAVLAIASSATADMTKDQCIDANTQGQSLRRDGKFADARAQLQRCGDPTCPAMLRDDCTRRLDELEREQPTVVFDAKDGAGHDLVAVKVTVDGHPLADTLEGKAFRVDPGAHSFTFATADQPPVTQTFVIKEGDKERRERIVIGTAPSPPPVPAPAAQPTTGGALPSTPPESPSPSGLGTQRILGLGLGAAGVVGIGLGSVFGLLASSAWSNAKNACGGDTSHCTNVSSADSYRSTTSTDGGLATVGFIAGGVLLAGGAVLFLTGGHHEAATAARVTVAPTFGRGQGGFAVTGGF
jgi:hypothetical protein